MRVVVDTNILYGDYWFRRSAFRVLVDSGRNVGCILCIPQLIVDELCNKYRENLQTECETIKKGVARLGRLIDQHVPMPVTENQLDMVVKTFRHRLREMIAAAGGAFECAFDSSATIIATSALRPSRISNAAT